MIIQTIYIGF